MVKRFLKGIVAVAAVLSMSVNVMASGSIVGAFDTPKVKSSQGNVTLANVTENTYGGELQKTVNRLNNAPQSTTVAAAFGSGRPQIDLYDENGLQIENVDLSQYKFLSPVMDLQMTGVSPTAENPVEVTFVANNMTDNMQVDVLHYCDKHQWEVLEGEKLSSNEVAADFHSASPVALIYKEIASTTGTDAKAPQTGEPAVWPLAVTAVGMAGFGAFAVKKSKKAGC